MDATLTPSDIESWWRELDARETQTKIANLAAVELAKRYHSLDGGDKAVFEATMIDWLKSDVGRKQFTSLAVVASCSMVAALPLLRELAAKLETDPTPSSAIEWQDMNRLIGRLAETEARER